ncbi:MAG: hypothetical protein KDA85_19345, partial [Planctomycetaceae bacterium]|nr:hypothetical protein [Planctomycetaceae bacterium]
MSKVKKRFAGYPTADVYEDDNGRKGRKKIQQLLWGDEFLQYEETDGDYVRVQVRVGEGSVTKKGWMKSGSIARERLLEATFVDIGQGDGCLLVMPDNRRYVIDAGKQDHMSRFLKWRFMFMKDRTDFEAAVITHPDADHYQGFDAVLSLKNAVFRNVYHNGLVERRGDHSLGEPVGSHLRVFPPIVTDQDLRQLLDGEKGKKSRKNYPDLLTKAANQTQPTAKFQMLSRADEYLPGCEADKNVVVQILGPVMEATEHDGTTVHGLRMFPGDDGKANNSKSKNGHSVVLRLTYGKVRMLLGGDLNIPAEELLLETLMDGAPLPPREQKRAREKYIKQAREKLEVDIAKSCHHGSADFSSLFLEVVNPVATVISSGDDGSYSHPRAETLGAIGVNSRGH